MRYHIAHSVRGRLRLRVPSPWLRTRQGAVESRLRALTGVRAVAGNTLTGSLRIDYDPFRLAEQSLVDELKHLDAHLTGAPPARRRGAQPAALLVWVRAVGEYFVARTVVTARRSLRDVVAPPDATVARVEGETTRPARVAVLRVGDVVVVPGGQRIPVDGTVVGGEALVNQQ